MSDEEYRLKNAQTDIVMLHGRVIALEDEVASIREQVADMQDPRPVMGSLTIAQKYYEQLHGPVTADSTEAFREWLKSFRIAKPEPVDNSKPAERTEWEFNCSKCNTLKEQLATARRLLSYTHPYQSTSSEYQDYRAEVERFLEATK